MTLPPVADCGRCFASATLDKIRGRTGPASLWLWAKAEPLRPSVAYWPEPGGLRNQIAWLPFTNLRSITSKTGLFGRVEPEEAQVSIVRGSL